MRDRHDNLVDLLFARAEAAPERLAYRFLADDGTESETRTWEGLARRASAVAASLSAAGVGSSPVLLLLPPGLDFLDAFLGCLAAGAVAVPAYPPTSRRSLGRIGHLFADARPPAVLTTGAVLARLRRWWRDTDAWTEATWIEVDSLADGAADGWRRPPVDTADLAFLQYTSGSTSRPKGVMVRHANLWHNQGVICRACGHDADTVFVSWLPLYHDLGLIGNVLQNLYVGSHCVLTSPVAFLQRPRLWLEAITRYRATTSGGPNFAYELCLRRVGEEDRAGLDLSSWRVAFNGAEQVREETLRRFADGFAGCGLDRSALYPCYGLAEATLMVSGGRTRVRQVDPEGLLHGEAREVAADSLRARPLVASGVPLPGQRVRIVDPDSARPLPAGRVGEIWVGGPSIAAGYWQRPEQTAETFQARLADGDGPFLRTGDLGFLDDEGHLFVSGRRKDLIIIRGRNYYPQDLELSAERSSDDLRPGGGAAFSVEVEGEERPVVVCEVERHHGDLDLAVEAVRRAVSEEYELQLHDVVLIRTGSLPKTTSGKVRRGACRDLYLAGELTVEARGRATVAGEAPMEPPPDLDALGEAERRPAAERYLVERCARVLRTDPAAIAVAAPLTSYGLDSLAAAELQHRVEEELGRAPSFAALLGGQSIQRLAADLAAPREPGEGGGVTQETTQETTRETTRDVTAGAEAGELPTSFAQRSMWFLHRLAPASPAYNIAVALRLPENVAPAALRRALDTLVRRHPVLRSRIVERAGDPVLEVAEAAEATARLERHEAADLDPGALAARLEEEANRPFDLAAETPLRCAHFATGDGGGTLVLTAHHAALDGWSLWRLLGELRRLLAAAADGRRPDLPPAAGRWTDYASWQRRLVAGERGRRLEDFWRRRAAAPEELAEVPGDGRRDHPTAAPARSFHFTLDADLVTGLRALAHRRGATVYCVLLAAFQVLVARFSGLRRVAIGSPLTGRSRSWHDGLVGCLFNLVPMSADLGSDPPFEELVDRVLDDVVAALEHQDYPSHLIAAGAERDGRRSGPLYPVTFLFQEPPAGERVTATDGAWTLRGADGASLELVPIERRAARADLEMEMLDAGDEIAGWLHYRCDLYSPAAAERLAAAYRRLLAAVVAAPRRRVGDLDLLTAEEWRRVTAEWSRGPGVEAPVSGSLIQHLERRVDDAPAAVAAIYRDSPITYRQLDEQANRLANLLRRIEA